MAEWKRVRLGEILEFQRGYDLPHSKMVAGEYPVIGSSGIIGWHNEYTTESPSISIGRSGSIGRPFIYKGKSWSHNTALYIKDFKGNEPRFIYYFLFVVRPWDYGSGSAVPTLNRNDLHDIEVSIPPLATQRKIAAVLGAIDDKIETNRKICANLEDVASIYFKHLFGRCSDDNMLLRDFVEVRRGQIITKSSAKHGPVPVIAAGLTPAYYTNKSNANPPVITISASGANAGYVGLHLYDIWASDCSYISRNETPFVYFIYNLLKSKSAEIRNMQKGTAQPHVHASDLMQLGMFTPCIEDVSKFETLVSPMYDDLRRLQKESRALASMRDALLPRLMSGEIDVEKVEVA